MMAGINKTAIKTVMIAVGTGLVANAVLMDSASRTGAIVGGLVLVAVGYMM